MPPNANIVFSIHRGGALVAEDLPGRIESAFDAGRVGTPSYTHQLWADLGVDLRDDYAGGTADVVRIPSPTDVPYRVVFVDRPFPNSANDCVRAHLRRETVAWPLGTD